MSFLRPRDEGADAESGMSDSPHHALLGAERVAAARKEETARRVQILLVCCAYALTGPTLVLANNHILKRLGFPYPLMLSACGLLTTSVVCALIHHVRHWRRQRAAGGDAQEGVELQRVNGATPLAPGSPAAPSTPGGRRDAPPQVSWRFWLLNMVPIGAAQGVTFAATNAAYMHLTITFTQMLAAFTPTVTMVLLYLLNVESPSTRAAACVLLISIGSAVSAYGEGNFHPVGVAYRCLGIFSEALRLVLMQKLLKNQNLGVLELQYYLAPIGATFLLAGARRRLLNCGRPSLVARRSGLMPCNTCQARPFRRWGASARRRAGRWSARTPQSSRSRARSASAPRC